MQAKQVCGNARNHCADRVTKISPKPVHADGRRAPRRQRHVSDCCKESGIDHGGSYAEERGTQRETEEALRHRDDGDTSSLCPHTGSNQPLPSNTVRKRTRSELHETPGRRINSGKRGRALQTQTCCCEEQRE